MRLTKNVIRDGGVRTQPVAAATLSCHHSSGLVIFISPSIFCPRSFGIPSTITEIKVKSQTRIARQAAHTMPQPVKYGPCYSAACAVSAAFSIRAAQYLNSGILPKGSSCGLVRMLAAASA